MCRTSMSHPGASPSRPVRSRRGNCSMENKTKRAVLAVVPQRFGTSAGTCSRPVQPFRPNQRGANLSDDGLIPIGVALSAGWEAPSAAERLRPGRSG
jgi:hypothetical protein